MKKALITGGSRGIGAATVKRFTRDGYRCFFLYKENDEKAKALEEETGATAIRCDVSCPEDLAKAKAITGEVDALVCNAGISLVGLFQDATKEEWEHLRSVNLDGVIYTVQTYVPGMISKKQGSIVLLSSMWGRVGASCESLYATTKAALQGLTMSLAKELGPSGIRVNCVAPGVIDTEMNKNLSEEDMKILAEETPLGRIGGSDEVADAIEYLISDRSSFITGQIIGVDGGFVLQ